MPHQRANVEQGSAFKSASSRDGVITRAVGGSRLATAFCNIERYGECSALELATELATVPRKRIVDPECEPEELDCGLVNIEFLVVQRPRRDTHC